MSITHEQAHQLIQLDLDSRLSGQEFASLSTHLRECTECQAYANQFKEVEAILIPILKRHWNARPVPLSIAALTRRNPPAKTTALLTMRTAAISLVFMALFFSAWQFLFAASTVSNQYLQPISPVPTPSILAAQSTSTQLTLESCALQQYTVQENDTLARIAEQFAVPEETLSEINHLEVNTLYTSMELIIPVCNFTPTGTSNATTFATTYTPVLYVTTSTPGG